MGHSDGATGFNVGGSSAINEPNARFVNALLRRPIFSLEVCTRRREFIAGLGAMAWPLAARARQPVVGLLDLTSPRPNATYVAEFRQGLVEAGFVEGLTVAIEYRWANNQWQRLAPLTAELVQRRVAVIVAIDSGRTVLAAKAATSTIPIVFSVATDPIKFGLVVSLSRPGGNMTGVTVLSSELTGKRLDLLCKIATLATTVAYVTNNQGDPPALPGRQQKFDNSGNRAPGSRRRNFEREPRGIRTNSVDDL